MSNNSERTSASKKSGKSSICLNTENPQNLAKQKGRPRKHNRKVFEQPKVQQESQITDREAMMLIRQSIVDKGVDPQKLMDVISLCDRMLGNEDREYALKWTEWVKDTAMKAHIKTRDEQYGTVYWDCVLSEARHKILDSYLLYLEKNRKPKDKFYQPRRKCLMKIGLIQSLQDMIDDKLDILSISLPPGTGKGSRLSAKVLTPDGFVQMRDIHVGSKVIAGNGNVATVLGVFPLGKKPTYRFTMDDGSQTEVSDDHLWYVQTRDDRNRDKHRVVRTTDMLKNVRVENGKRLNYSIDYVPKIDFEEKELFIHPYVLGVLLGDGTISKNEVCISNVDTDLLEKVKEFMPEGYTIADKTYKEHYVVGSDWCERSGVKRNRSIFKFALEGLGLIGKVSDTKFIPKQYLYASYEQRLWLLRGLLDTDGYACEGSIEYTTASEQLAEDVRELVHSLGGYCSVVKRKAGYKNKNGEYVECKDSHRMVIQFSSEHPCPMYLPRKADLYRPKRSTIKRFVSSIDYIGEEECQCIYISDPCHLYITDDYIITHNTTLEKFFITGIVGWFPKDYNLFYSHSGDITRMFYDGCLDILKSDEYTWQEIFLDVSVGGTNAKTEQIQVGGYKPFPSIQTTSVGAKNAGKVRASKFLLCDDLIGGIEEALNKNILDKLWSIYSVDARQRKTVDTDQNPCKELHIATRWSVHDVIGRLQQVYDGNDRCRFIAVPDIDPKTGKSNFRYDYNGFTEEFFRDQELLMDEISYRCLYKNDPIEREGLLYHEDEIRKYFSLPDKEPDAIIGVCDTKTTGKDFMVLPCFYQYGNDYYLVDCVCDDSSDFGTQQRRVADLILRHNMQQVEFESNAGGGRFAQEIDKIVRDNGGRCNITTKPTETNKETRIIVNSDWVKRNCLFKEKDNYEPRTDYGRFMNFLLSYSVTGKNPHDDVVDALANFALNQTKSARIAKVEAVVNPFRGGAYGVYR